MQSGSCPSYCTVALWVAEGKGTLKGSTNTLRGC